MSLQPYEISRVSVVDGEPADQDARKPFCLRPGERRGWWSSHIEPTGRAGLAFVHGAICDRRTTILLDTGATTSLMSLALAKELRLRMEPAQMKVKGIGGVPTNISNKARVKVTLGHSVVYFMDIWIGNIGAGLECQLGMDFMVSAGVRLNTREGNVRLPDEERIPLAAPGARPLLPARVGVCTSRGLDLEPGHSAVVPVVYTGRQEGDLVLWLFRGDEWVTTVVADQTRRPTGIRVSNIGPKIIRIPQHTMVAQFVDPAHLPDSERAVRLGTIRYREWQLLVYENSYSRRSLRQQAWEDRLYQQALPPAVQKPVYSPPTRVLRRGEPDGETYVVRESARGVDAVELPEPGAEPVKEVAPEKEVPQEPVEIQDMTKPHVAADEVTSQSTASLMCLVAADGEPGEEPAEDVEAVRQLEYAFHVESECNQSDVEEATVMYHEECDMILFA